MTQRTTEVSIVCGQYGEEAVFLTAPWSSETGFSPYEPNADLWRSVQGALGAVERAALAVGVAITLSVDQLQDAGLGVAYSVVLVREENHGDVDIPHAVHTMSASGRMGADGWRAVTGQWEWEATSLMDACASERRPRICALVCTVAGVSRIIHVLDSETWRMLEKFLYWIGGD